MSIDDVLGRREVQAVRWADFLEYEISDVLDLRSDIEREDAEFVQFHGLLRKFRGVRVARGTRSTLRGPRANRFTARCPVGGSHELTVEWVVGGAEVGCERCAASRDKLARLGAWLERVTGMARRT